MLVEASRGTVQMRFGRRFSAAEAQRLAETVEAFAPVSDLTVDFTQVREFEDSAVVPLARTLRELATAHISLKGLTLHQARMLRYFGVEPHEPRPDAAALRALTAANA